MVICCVREDCAFPRENIGTFIVDLVIVVRILLRQILWEGNGSPAVSVMSLFCCVLSELDIVVTCLATIDLWLMILVCNKGWLLLLLQYITLEGSWMVLKVHESDPRVRAHPFVLAEAHSIHDL